MRVNRDAGQAGPQDGQRRGAERQRGAEREGGAHQARVVPRLPGPTQRQQRGELGRGDAAAEQQPGEASPGHRCAGAG